MFFSNVHSWEQSFLKKFVSELLHLTYVGPIYVNKAIKLLDISLIQFLCYCSEFKKYGFSLLFHCRLF